MSQSQAVRNRRLKLAQAEWRYQDRTRGNYTTYRNGRPYARVRRDKQQLKETLLAIALLMIIGIALGFAV